MKKLLSIVVVLLLSSTLLTAQKPGISIGGNAFFPAGDWAEFASTGWGGSVTYEHPLGRNIGGVIYSGYTSFSGDSGLDWTMVPLLVGAKFYFSPKVDWYFAALLGVNFVTANATILETDYSESATEFAGNLNFGYELKVGKKGAIDISAGFVYINDLSYYGMRLAYKFML